MGRFKLERGRPLTSLPKDLNVSSTFFNVKSQDQASLPKAELLPKFSPDKCFLSPNPKASCQPALTPEHCFPPPQLQRQLG